MAFFYLREENESEIIIQWAPWIGPVYLGFVVNYFLSLIVYFFWRNNAMYMYLVGSMGVLVLYILIAKVFTFNVTREIQGAARKTYIKCKGSRFSWKNPVKVIINKEEL